MDLTKLNSIKDVPASEIFAHSDDGKTLVTNDGTKVSNELIAEAKAQAKASTKAASAAAGGAITEEARASIIAEAQEAGRKAAQDEWAKLQAGGKK